MAARSASFRARLGAAGVLALVATACHLTSAAHVAASSLVMAPS